ncbi:MAG: tRNA (adenosine(37)-N6)-threonylcarbamoyltransferase complex dimerization subunit type 1 TsaB [Spirochaetales bacterium]|nr:tRNA (adenosine(37)-N6)-threonylcarbamoyltransferase complex dimerization subunit type 1 TsaB [Spirochaetales bacterium]MCF7937568.1 tRNA (adenosine(37)-N6)-threonylcarbamoyltransferase complex dimerization subunit type 1 TsaB [Spirochaetales bacterium]
MKTSEKTPDTVLAFDTGSELLSICLLTGNQRHEIVRDAGLKHASALMRLIDLLLQTTGTEIRDIDLLVCSAGPGSFTGLRVGMSTAKGLSEGADIPLVSVLSLDVYAASLDWFDGLVVPVIDAKKQRFYTAGYRRGERITDLLDLPVSGFDSFLSGEERVLLTGPDAQKVSALLSGYSGIYTDSRARDGKGRQMAELGKMRYTFQGADKPSSGPEYLRLSEAEFFSSRKGTDNKNEKTR